MSDFVRLTDKEGMVHLKKEPILAMSRPTAGQSDGQPWVKCVIYIADTTFMVKESPDEVASLLECPV